MVVKIRVSGAKKFQAKLQKISIFVNSEFAKNVIKNVYNWTLQIMPKDTGALKTALKYVSRKKTASLNQFAPRHTRQNPRPYHLWLNNAGNSSYTRRDGTTGTINITAFQARIRSGKVNYMKLAADEMIKRIIKEEFSAGFNKK